LHAAVPLQDILHAANGSVALLAVVPRRFWMLLGGAPGSRVQHEQQHRNDNAEEEQSKIWVLSQICSSNTKRDQWYQGQRTPRSTQTQQQQRHQHQQSLGNPNEHQLEK
jgi:hypothetical protein